MGYENTKWKEEMNSKEMGYGGHSVECEEVRRTEVPETESQDDLEAEAEIMTCRRNASVIQQCFLPGPVHMIAGTGTLFDCSVDHSVIIRVFNCLITCIHTEIGLHCYSTPDV